MLKQAEEYNKGWASIQLATDEKLRVKTVNLSVPGNTCTIAILMVLRWLRGGVPAADRPRGAYLHTLSLKLKTKPVFALPYRGLLGNALVHY